MRKNSSEFKTNFVSEPGTFRTNKDYFAFMELDDLACYAVADGIDSDEEKESAEIAVHALFADFMEKPSLSRRKIRQYLKNAHNLLVNESRSVRRKASLALMITDYTKMVYAVAGNARLYHFRNKRFNFKSKDQSIAQLMADSGKISEDDISEHEERHNLLNYLGTNKKFKPYISRKIYLREKDTILLCTSGMWENASGTEIIDVLREANEPEEFVDNLEELILGKQNDVLNNYTIAAIMVNKVFNDNSEGKKRKYLKVAAVAAMVLVLLVGGLFVRGHIMAAQAKAKAIMEQNQREAKLRADIVKNEETGDQLVKEGEYKQGLDAYGESLKGLSLVKEEDRDKEAEKRVQRKYDFVNAIVDGDEHFTNRNYEMALMSYLNAKADGEGLGFAGKALEERIAKTQGYISVLELTESGDNDFDRKNYLGAKQKYLRARSIADRVGFDNMRNILEGKIAEAQVKLEEAEARQKKYETARKYHRQAEVQMANKKFKEAIDFYNMAKSYYEELEMTEEVVKVQNRIREAEKKSSNILMRIFSGAN